MGFKSRKFFIWLISLGAVLAVYLLYSQLSQTPQIDIDTGAEFADAIAESNAGEFVDESEIGVIGDVGVGRVRKARYTHLNKKKQVDREFGFEKLLHEEGSEWEIEKPYMNIFRRNFKCYITSDRGKVQVETVVDRPSPKDVTLTGNVVIRILSENESSIKESFVYLDDIVFISERSLFSTAGPVKFINEDAEMLGRGLEVVYNDQLDRLEFLRIIHLESLHLKTPSKASLFSPSRTDAPNNEIRTMKSERRTPNNEPLTTNHEPQTTTNYRCVFSKNVVINSPEQLVFADEVSINDIQRNKRTERQRDKGNEQGTASHEPRATSHDIVVTCDNGIVVTPMDVDSGSRTVNREPSHERRATSDEPRTTFVARRIDYCAVTGDTIASGPSELTFYANDIMGAEPNETAVPVKITARKEAKFLPALNQVIFEGDCLCTMLREDSNSQQKYTLSAPRLTVDLSMGKDKQSSALVTGIKHLTATGGVVRLATVKTAGGSPERLLGGIELKCRKFDFDTGRQLFLATGPGIIKLDNSNIAEPNAGLDRFSLQRRCYAFVRNFDTLKYSLEANRIIADAGGEGILIDYFPIVKGQYSRQVAVTAGHIEALLYETAGGQTELSTLSAIGGIVYEEEDIQFAGSQLFYDANSSIMTVQGSESQPCLLNGALVDGIEYDLKTGKVKAEISGPGVLRMKR